MPRFLRLRRNLNGIPWLNDRAAIVEFNRSLSLIADGDALMAAISARIRDMFGADRIVLLRQQSINGMFTVAFSTGYDASEMKGVHLGNNGRLAKWLLRNETPLVVKTDAGVIDYIESTERELLAKLRVTVCLPLIALNRLSGMAFLSSSDENWSIDSERLAILQMLTSQAGIAFESADLYRQQRDRLRTLYRAERLAAAGQLAASIAHEVRNPLTAIRSTVQYLLNDFDQTNPKRRLMEGVIGEVDRIDRTVDGLLSLTRQVEFTPELISLSKLIDESLLLIRTQARKQSVEVTFNGPTDEVWIVGDSSQIKQLLLNVMLNALQAMQDSGRLSLDLRAESRSAAGPSIGLVELTVADTGSGIAPEDLERIFDPFFTTKPGGTGLGIPISYAIAKRHGGDMVVHSAESKGTQVSIKLPLADKD